MLDRRLEQMEAEGVKFKTNANVGEDISVDDLKKDFDAIVLTGGACDRRDLPAEGRELKGIYQAMEYLPMQNRLCEGDEKPDGFISAEGKDVVIIGGGDTGADCLGTANRQGAKSVHQLEIMPKPPTTRAEDNPWPEWPRIFPASRSPTISSCKPTWLQRSRKPTWFCWRWVFLVQRNRACSNNWVVSWTHAAMSLPIQRPG